MTRPIPSLVCLISLIAAAPAQRDRRNQGPELEHFTTKSESFESEALGRDAQYRVFLPKGYDDEANAEKQYPIVIWLHGLWEDHNRFFTRGGAKALDELRVQEEIPEMIVVCANGGTSFYINGVAKKSAYEDMIVDELLDHCAETYRVDPNRSARAIAGVSMGGYGALKIALKHPDKFGVVAAHSAALLPRDPDQLEEVFPWLKRFGGAKRAITPIFGKEIDKEKWRDENVLELVESIDPEKIEGLKLYLDCGDADRYGFFEPNEELVALLEKREIPHTWRAVEGGGHGWRSGYNQAAIPESLRFLASAFTVKRAAAGLGGMFGKPPAAKESSGRK